MKNRILSGKWDGFYPGDWVRPRNNLGTWIPLIDTAEILAKDLDISRADQEAFAIASHKKALSAIDVGNFKQEIIPTIDAYLEDGTVVDW